MHFLKEQFVNEQIKHLLGEKSVNPPRKRYYGNECFCFAWDRIKVRQNCLFYTTAFPISLLPFL